VIANSDQALWTSRDAAAATGGKSNGDWAASGVSIDSRTTSPGDLFVALKGPNFDGHEYIGAAFKAGAAAAMAQTDAQLENGEAILTVADSLAGLAALGIAGRGRAVAKVVAVTGSVGKTGVKEALAQLLGRQGETSYSPGSFNNHVGVPLSLARLIPGASYAVFELGMNHAGELTPLSNMVRPHVVIITNVEPAHLEFFASLDDIAEAKAEVFSGLVEGGTAILNRDNPYFDLLATRAKDAGAGRVVGFGAHDDAEFRLTGCELSADGAFVASDFDGHSLEYRIGLAGRHWVQNSLAVLAAVHAAGADVFEAAGAFSTITPGKGRGARHRIDTGKIEFLLIDDSYNASPVSVNAALAALSAIEITPSGRRIVVLGDMLELGDASDEMHLSLAEIIEAGAIDLVFTAGQKMGLLFNALPAAIRGAATDHASELSDPLISALQGGDVVLVKGSAGSETGVIVNALLGLDRAEVKGKAKDIV